MTLSVECSGSERKAVPAPPPEPLLCLRVFGWNLGGAPLEDLQGAVIESASGNDKERVVLLQECPRRASGWVSQLVHGWRVVQHRAADQWRGTGVCFHPGVWTVVSKKSSKRGLWVKLKHLASGLEVWMGSAHLPPGLTQAEYHADAADFLASLPGSAARVIFQGDINAPFCWVKSPVSDAASGQDGKSIILLDLLFQKGLVVSPVIRSQQHLPTSRPRQEARVGSRIDLFASKGLLQRGVRVFPDSCHTIGTDHDLQEGSFAVRGSRKFVRPPTRSRVWVGGVEQVHALDHVKLCELARKCTKPKPSAAFRDGPDTKAAFRRARVNKTKESWKQALGMRRSERRASQCDWTHFRESKGPGQGAWDMIFADAQVMDPHTVVEQHLTGVYAGEGIRPCVEPVGPVIGFSDQEVKTAVHQMGRNKSVGVDLTGREFFVGLLGVEGGPSHLAEFFTQILTTRRVPTDWNTSILILLAKVQHPLTPKDLRPIALGSGASKLFARLLLNRCMMMLGPRSPYQCARQHRQTCDYVFSVWRVFELCREWGVPLCCVKVDVQKAFDSVSRPMLVATLRARLGDTPEMACWEQLLSDTKAILVTPWGVSGFLMERGINQGAVESPCFFGLLMETALEETARKYKWGEGRRTFTDFEHEGILFMDDGFLWHSDRLVVQERLAQLTGILATYGLVLNPKKCQLYCSKDVPKPHRVSVAGTDLEASDHVELMGLRVAKGISPCALIQPLVARAKQKFWSLKHLLRCKTPAKGRLLLLQRVVAGCALWCISAVPPDRSAMGLLNSVQTMLIGWMLRFFKGSDETWVQFRIRVVRGARAALHRSGTVRWSTLWLQRWWITQGTGSDHLCRLPPLEWAA